MPKRKMLSSDRQAQIKDRLTNIGKQLRKWPYPIMAPEREIVDIISELEGIIRLNMDEHYGPVTLFDRAVKWQRRAQVIRSRRADHECDMGEHEPVPARPGRPSQSVPVSK